MKRIIVAMAVCCCAGTVPVEACPENHTETTVSTSHPEKRNTESKEALGTEFVFDVYGDIPVAKVVFESDHFALLDYLEQGDFRTASTLLRADIEKLPICESLVADKDKVECVGFSLC